MGASPFRRSQAPSSDPSLRWQAASPPVAAAEQAESQSRSLFSRLARSASLNWTLPDPGRELEPPPVTAPGCPLISVAGGFGLRGSGAEGFFSSDSGTLGHARGPAGRPQPTFCLGRPSPPGIVTSGETTPARVVGATDRALQLTDRQSLPGGAQPEEATPPAVSATALSVAPPTETERRGATQRVPATARIPAFSPAHPDRRARRPPNTKDGGRTCIIVMRASTNAS